MRAAALALGVVCCALLGAASNARAETPKRPSAIAPFRMVRSLQLVQDRVAYGDHAALPIQRKLLEMIDERLRNTSAAELMQPQNFRSMMVYAMSGGNPATLTSVLFRLHLDDKQSKIAGAVLAYLRGSSKFASVALKDIEPMQEPKDIGAFLALIKGSVISLEDPQSALKLLDKARLLSPGTLVEEAALRRSVSLAATVGDATRFTLAIDQYVRSYLRSPYASQFADALVAGVVQLRESLDLASVEATVALMSAEQQKVIYLRIARRAAIDGLVGLSEFASEKAKAIDVPGDAEIDPRILLYTSLTSVTTESAARLQEKIAKIDRSRLSPGDRELLDAVSAVSDKIVEAPSADPGPEPVRNVTTERPTVEPSQEANVDIAEPSFAPQTAEAAAAKTEMARDADATEMAPKSEPPTLRMKADAKASKEATSAADAMVADGRKMLAEIDELLAGATE